MTEVFGFACAIPQQSRVKARIGNSPCKKAATPGRKGQLHDAG